VNFPEDLRYTAEHQWIRREDEGTALIGITDFAQEELGDIVYVEFPEIGALVQRDTPFGVVESNKSSSDVYAPWSGVVVAINDALEEEPSAINDDPYGVGWLIRIRLSEPVDLSELLDGRGYRRLVEG
jgi:glycine cleavage system H protein